MFFVFQFFFFCILQWNFRFLPNTNYIKKYFLYQKRKGQKYTEHFIIHIFVFPREYINLLLLQKVTQKKYITGYVKIQQSNRWKIQNHSDNNSMVTFKISFFSSSSTVSLLIINDIALLPYFSCLIFCYHGEHFELKKFSRTQRYMSY